MMTTEPIRIFVIIAAITAGAVITRFLPFVLFPESRKTPDMIHYLGQVLPAAMIGLLVVYCYKGVKLSEGSRGLPELLATLSIIILHRWKQNTFLSIGAGTVIYMLLHRYM